MTAKSPSWNKRLTARIRSDRRADPEFNEEYLAEKKTRQPPLLDRLATWFAYVFGAPAFFVLIPIGIALPFSFEQALEPRIALIGYVLTIAMFLIAAILLSQLCESKDLNVCSHLPVSDSDLVRRIWKRVFLSTLLGLWYLAAINVALFISSFSIPASIALAIGFAILQWGFTLGVGTWLASASPTWPHGKIACWMITIGTLAIAYVIKVDPQILDHLVWVGLLSPGGWVGDALWLGVLLEYPTIRLAALPALLVTICLPVILKSFQHRFRIREFIVWQGQKLYSIFGESFTGTHADQFAPITDSGDDETPEVSEEYVRRYWQHLDDSFDWTHRGWQERFFAKWLTPRERKLVMFLTGDVTYWSSLWIALFTAALMLTVLVATGMWPFALESSFGFLLIVSVVAALCVILDSFPGLYMTKCSGNYVSHFANYPLGTSELSKVFLKIAFFKSCFLCLMLTPFLVPLIANVPIPALSLTACLFTGVMCLSFWRLGFLLSCGYAMPRFMLRNFWVPAVMIQLFTVTVTSAIFSVISAVQQLPWLLPQLVACWGSSVAIWWIFKNQVDRSRVDLVTVRNLFGDQFWENLETSRQQMEASYWRRKYLQQRYGTFWWLRRRFG